MICIELKSFKTVSELCNICSKYKNKFDVDVIHGRYTVDGNSILGVTSLIDNVVELVPVTSNMSEVKEFYNSVKGIGAYKSDEVNGE